MIAGFLVLLWLVPMDSTSVPIALPFDSNLDRFALTALVVVWLAVAGVAGEYGPWRERSPVNVAVLLFLIVATGSVILNIASVARAEELQLALNNLSKVFSYAALFLVVATSVRKREIPRFSVLFVALACVTAVGTIIEYRIGTNYFYDLAGKLLPGLYVGAEPPNPVPGRPFIAGPSQHALAVATMLAMAIPFALVGLLNAKDFIQRLLCAFAVGLLFAGAVATLRKTALVAPAAALVPLIFYAPRQMARLLPIGVVSLLFVLAVAPGALQGIRDQLTGHNEIGSESRISTEGRTADYAAVRPDVLSDPLLGRGYGTYDPNAHETKQVSTHHRFLDNEYLTLLVETGILGVIAYIGLGLTGILVLQRAARSRDPLQSGPALAITGALVAFLVSSALYDTMFFVQGPYLLFFLLGLAVVVAAGNGSSAPDGRAT
jgi:O-antigen ligase